MRYARAGLAGRAVGKGREEAVVGKGQADMRHDGGHLGVSPKKDLQVKTPYVARSTWWHRRQRAEAFQKRSMKIPTWRSN